MMMMTTIPIVALQIECKPTRYQNTRLAAH